jgi:hypothetical protein
MPCNGDSTVTPDITKRKLSISQLAYWEKARKRTHV